MKAIAIRRGDSAPRLLDLPRPDPGPGEALVRTLRVGVDGTDHEVIEGAHGGFPEGEDHLVLGHEAVGVVADPNGTRFSAGDVVVPTVRRPPGGETNEAFERGQADMLPPDQTHERGIDGAHGFMSEYFTSPEQYLVSLPEDLAPLGFLVEPISITEKAVEHAYASRAAFDWEPESAFVLGNGSLGLLTLAMLRDYDRTYCLGRRDRPDPSIDLVERLGATYVDSRETPVPEVPDVHEPMDFVYEATGYARHAVEAVGALAPGGVAALLGVPEPWTFEVDVGSLHRDVVMNNKAVVGTVNSSADHFRAAADTLAGLPDWITDEFQRGVTPVEDFERAFDPDETTIKTAVQFSAR
ncbi:glucose dehydrogenase [Halobacteriales archaeon QS_8_69_26]|nr:MAG: glucose dehydrogenase [Halobacteriales archaeon QS_8_69_26]